MVDGNVFRGQTAKVSMETEGGTSVTVGALQDAEISIEFEDEELRGQSLKVIEKQRTEVNISVSASFGAFDLAGFKELIGYDDTDGSINDSPEPPTFNVTGNFVSADGSQDFDVKVTGVTFENPGLSWSRDEFVMEDLEGTGIDIELTDNTSSE